MPQWTAAVLGGSDARLIKQLKGFSVNNPVFSLPPTADGVNRTFANIKSLVLGEIMYGNKLAPRWAYENFVAAGCETFEPSPYCDGLRDQLVRFGGDCYLGNACGDNMWVAPSGNGSLGVETVTVNDVDVAWDAYLSRADVQAAIHAKPPHGGGAWVQCGGIGYDVTWPSSLIPYGAAFAAGLKVLVFSGDGDATTCPFSGTQVAIMALQELPGAAITKNWTAWSVNGQTAGYIERHGAAFTFATVKGAGHEAVSAHYSSAHARTHARAHLHTHLHSCPRPRVTRTRARILTPKRCCFLPPLSSPCAARVPTVCNVPARVLVHCRHARLARAAARAARGVGGAQRPRDAVLDAEPLRERGARAAARGARRRVRRARRGRLGCGARQVAARERTRGRVCGEA